MARFISLLLVAGLAIFGFFAPHAAHAQTPDAIQGIWTAERDCSDGEFVMITGPTIAKLGDGLLIIFDDGEIKTYMLRARQARDGWTEVTLGDNNEVSFLKRDGNRLARREELPRIETPPGETPPGAAPPENQNGQAEVEDEGDFVIACETAPVRWQVLHGEAINFFLRQSALEPECDGSDRPGRDSPQARV